MKILEMKDGKGFPGEPTFFPSWEHARQDMEQRFIDNWDAVTLEETRHKNGVQSICLKDRSGKIFLKYIKPLQ